jgi:LmbE family N-acetylglucosaminyl deacetylase
MLKHALALTCGAFLVFLLGSGVTQARTIVVVAPHPDDEALCCSGVIYSAVQRGDTVYVVVMTNGDFAGTSVGLTREGESVAAMGLLGVGEQHIIFLGYGDELLLTIYQSSDPDEVYTSNAGMTQTYGDRGLGGVDYHYYVHGIHGPYSRSTMMGDLTTALQNIRPDEIYTTGIVDGYSDHEATGMAVVEAIRTIQQSDKTFQPRLHETVIHAPNNDGLWPEPVFTPTVPFAASQCMAQTPLDWTQIESIPVPAVMQDPDPYTNLKHQVIDCYQSQILYGFNDWIFSFLKQNEFFLVRTPSLNAALQATVTDSSEALGGNNAGTKAIDGDIPSQFAGIPYGPITDREWVTNDQLAGAWIQLSWTSPVTVNEVLLSDRPDPSENVLAGTLTFSDGSSIDVGALPIYGTPYPITFAAKTITWVEFTITQAQGTATGLAEFQVLVPSAPVPIAVTFDPYQIFAGGSSQGSVTLSAPNPTSDTTVQLSSDNPAASLPSAVTVPAGATNGTFTVAVASSVQTCQANIAATANGASQTGILEITSVPPLSGVSFDNDNVVGGATVSCTVTLAEASPTNAVVPISSTNPAAQVPTSVMIAAGSTSTTFAVPTLSVSAYTTGAITASYGGANMSASLTVAPPTIGLTVASRSSGSATISPGSSADYLLSIGGQGIGGIASISCTGTPAGATCTLPTSVSVNSTTPGTFAVVVTTTSQSAALFRVPGSLGFGRALWLCALSVAGFFILILRERGPAKRWAQLALLFVLAPIVLAVCSCRGGSGGNSTVDGTAAGTYQLTITAQIGAASQSTDLTLVVR